jgi:L-ascorbate metabolism protein UlaG (beta-lactamase superfamily)
MSADPLALSITYICNDGFIIANVGKKILIDALFHDSRNICQADADEIAQNAQAPFDNADLVLISFWCETWEEAHTSTVCISYLSN